MAVHQVIMQAILFAEILKAPGEIGEVGIYRQFMYLLVFACPEVNEASVLAHLIYHFVSGVVDPGVDVNPMPRFAQLAG
jgi:hypothetical protein